jgi:putative endonuclease
MHGTFSVYILASKPNGMLYVGVTNNLPRRLLEHKAKLVPGFTRKYEVDRLVYFETFDSILEARAHSLKRWRRAWKIALIEKLNPDWRDLSDELSSEALLFPGRCAARSDALLIRGPCLNEGM